MNSNLKRFVVKITAVTAVIALGGWLAFSLFIPEYYLPVMPWALLFFYVVTILVHAYQLRLAKRGMPAFTRSSMLVTFLKLVVYSVFAVAYIAARPENALVFVVCLMLLYLVYTFLEVAEISRVSRKG